MGSSGEYTIFFLFDGNTERACACECDKWKIFQTNNAPAHTHTADETLMDCKQIMICESNIWWAIQTTPTIARKILCGVQMMIIRWNLWNTLRRLSNIDFFSIQQLGYGHNLKNYEWEIFPQVNCGERRTLGRLEWVSLLRMADGGCVRGTR